MIDKLDEILSKLELKHPTPMRIASLTSSVVGSENILISDKIPELGVDMDEDEAIEFIQGNLFKPAGFPYTLRNARILRGIHFAYRIIQTLEILHDGDAWYVELGAESVDVVHWN